MPIFEFIIMVDWSGGNRRRANRDDCIWLAYGTSQSHQPTCASSASRTDAVQLIRQLLQPYTLGQQKRRALVCFDFPYGFPQNFASHLPALPSSNLPWRRVWHYLANAIQDDLGTKPGRCPSNKSNRFFVANSLNELMSPRLCLGPFWCTDKPDQYPAIPQQRPLYPFASSQEHQVSELRLTDQRVQADCPFRLFGTGSVGSQAILGIPCIERLRQAPELSAVSVVWPFETGWVSESDEWLSSEKSIVHAEIYPSVQEPYLDTVKDRGQVRAMWDWARDLDAGGKLLAHFRIPPGIVPNSIEDLVVRQEEGWILH